MLLLLSQVQELADNLDSPSMIVDSDLVKVLRAMPPFKLWLRNTNM